MSGTKYSDDQFTASDSHISFVKYLKTLMSQRLFFLTLILQQRKRKKEKEKRIMKSLRPSLRLRSLLSAIASSSSYLAYSTSQIGTAYRQTPLGHPFPRLPLNRPAAGIRGSRRKSCRGLDSFRALGLWIRCPVLPKSEKKKKGKNKGNGRRGCGELRESRRGDDGMTKCWEKKNQSYICSQMADSRL